MSSALDSLGYDPDFLNYFKKEKISNYGSWIKLGDDFKGTPSVSKAYEQQLLEEKEHMANRKTVYEVTVGYAPEETFEFVTVVAATPENARVKGYLALEGPLADIDIDDLDFGISAVLMLREVKETN